MTCEALSDDPLVLLTAWYALMDIETPTSARDLQRLRSRLANEKLPVEYAKTVAELAAAAGKVPRYQFTRYQLQMDVPRKRQVRRRKGPRGQLTT